MMSEIDVATMIAQTNKQLRLPQQIHPDDPILTNVILNEHILNVQISAFKKKLDETVQQLKLCSEEQNKAAELRAEAMTDRLIAGAGTHIEKQLNAAAQRWEQHLRMTCEQTEANARRASLMSWCGAALIVFASSLIIGLYLGNLAFESVHRPHQHHQ